MDIYIKPVKKANVTAVDVIRVKDVAEVIGAEDAVKEIENMKLMDIKTEEKKANFLISVTDIIKAIKKTYPDASISNVGVQDTLVQYRLEKSKENAFLQWAKVAFVVLILLAGSSTAIMSFHTDGQIPKVFESYYRIFFGEHRSNPLIINIPYAIGLAAGILVFFNHILGKKITDDPTPIEVEMSLYETEVNETMLDILNTEESQNGDS